MRPMMRSEIFESRCFAQQQCTLGDTHCNARASSQAAIFFSRRLSNSHKRHKVSKNRMADSGVCEHLESLIGHRSVVDSRYERKGSLPWWAVVVDLDHALTIFSNAGSTPRLFRDVLR